MFNFTVKEFILGNGTGTPTFQFYRRGFNLGPEGGSPGPSWQDIILHGNTALTLVNAKADSLTYLKLFGGTEQRNLPKGYTQLDYIESSGTQYIDTGLKLNQNNIVEVRHCYYTESDILTSGRVFGARYTSGSRNSFSIGSNTGMSSVETMTFAQFGDNYIPALNNIVIGQWNTYKVSADGFYINDIKQGDFSATTFETPFTVKLFAFEQASSSGATSTIGCGIGRCKQYKVWSGDTLVMNLISVKNASNVVGMYDMVSGTFLTNAGTGDFVAGPAVVPTPDEPINIVSNNGTIKYSANICNVNEQTALIGYYISSSGVVTSDNNNWIYQDFIPVKPNTTYTLTMSSSVYYVTISEYSTADDSGFIIRKTGISGDNTTLTITTESTTNYIRFGTNLDRSAVTLDRILAINWMLNVGDTMAYQPYVDGGIYTDGTVETVNIHTKNLFSGIVEQGGLGDSSGGETPSSVRIRSTYISVKPNTTYNFSWVTNSEMAVNVRAVHFYNASNTWISRVNTTTFTTPPNTAYIRVVWQHSTTTVNITPSDISNVQLELGSTATTYEPYYNGGTAVAEMLLKVGDYQDTQSVLDGEVTRNIGVKVLDGTEDIGKSGAYAGSFFIRNVVSGWGTTNLTPVFCTHFSNVTTESAYNAQGKCIILNNAFNMWWGSDSTPTAAQFSAWLAEQYANGNPVIVVYPLATATTETVTGQPLTIQAGTNIVEITQASIDNLGLEVSYKGVV